MKKFFKKPIVIVGGAVALILIVVAVVQGSKDSTPRYETVSAATGNLKQVVSVTGRIKPAESVNLAFERSGRVAAVTKQVGEVVEAGQILVTLGAADTQAQLLQYQAALESERARLEELQRGSRPEEIFITETVLDNAKSSLALAEQNLTKIEAQNKITLENLYDDIPGLLFDVYAKADDAVSKQTDEMFRNDFSSNPELSFTTSDTEARSHAESLRVGANNILKEFKEALETLPNDIDANMSLLMDIQLKMSTVRNLLDRLTSALNGAVDLSPATQASYKASVNTGRTNINTAIDAIVAKRQSIEAQKAANETSTLTAQTQITRAQNDVKNAENELALKKSGTAPEQIKAQEARVNQARANIANIQADLAGSILTAPIRGVITKQEATVGEIAQAGALIVSIISEAEFEVEAQVPEADIAKIQIGNPVAITLDAYGDSVIFNANVVTIDPAETIIDGIPTYTVTLQFTEKDPRIKSGMTANADVTTAMRDGVLIIPQRAVIKNAAGQTIVRVLTAENTLQEIQVDVGIRGSDGMIEIMSGIEAGQKVVTFIPE